MRTTRRRLKSSKMRSLHILALDRLGERDRPGLTARDGRLGLVLGKTKPALDAARLDARDVAGHVLDARVVVGVDDDRV